MVKVQMNEVDFTARLPIVRVQLNRLADRGVTKLTGYATRDVLANAKTPPKKLTVTTIGNLLSFVSEYERSHKTAMKLALELSSLRITVSEMNFWARLRFAFTGDMAPIFTAARELGVKRTDHMLDPEVKALLKSAGNS